MSVVGGQLGSSRIHLLAIFPPSTKAAVIDRIYGPHAGDAPFPAEEDRTGKEEFKLNGSLADWAELIRSQAGIFVAAHVDEPRVVCARGSGRRERDRSASSAPARGRTRRRAS